MTPNCLESQQPERLLRQLAQTICMLLDNCPESDNFMVKKEALHWFYLKSSSLKPCSMRMNKK